MGPNPFNELILPSLLQQFHVTWSKISIWLRYPKIFFVKLAKLLPSFFKNNAKILCTINQGFVLVSKENKEVGRISFEVMIPIKNPWLFVRNIFI